MTTAQTLAPHLRARRLKVFAGSEKPRQLDRNFKARLMTRGRALMRKTKKGKHYGAITAKDYGVLGARCIPMAADPRFKPILQGGKTMFFAKSRLSQSTLRRLDSTYLRRRHSHRQDKKSLGRPIPVGWRIFRA